MEIDEWTDIKLSKYTPILEFINNLYKKLTVQLPLRNLIQYVLESYDLKMVNLYQKQGVTFTIIPQAELIHGKNFVELLLNIYQSLDSTQIGINFSDRDLKVFKEYYLRIDELPDLQKPPIVTAKNPNNIDTSYPERPSALTYNSSIMSDHIRNDKLVQDDIINLAAKIKPSEDHKTTVSYDYFNIHEAACLIANLNPNYDSSSTQLDDLKSVIKEAIESGELIVDKNDEINIDILKEFLLMKGSIFVGFKDDTFDTSNFIDRNNSQILEENHLLKEEIFSLKNQLSQIESELVDIKTNSISNLDIQNIKKRAIAQANRNLAEALKSLDYQNKLIKKDIINFIKPYMKNLALVLSDGNQNKADKLVVSEDTLSDNHLKGLEFKIGRQTNLEKEKLSINLIFKKEPPISD